MAATATTFDGFLKEYYTNDKIAELVYTDRPALEHIKKDGSGSGRRCIQPILWGNPQGLGTTVALAQAGAEQASNLGTAKVEDWIVPWGDYSGNVQIASKLLKQSRDNVGAFMRAKSVEIDGIFNAFADTMAAYLYREGRNLAVSTGTPSSGVVTVSNYQDLANIHVGMILQASADNGSSSSHALTSGSAEGFVFAVDRDAGTFTVATSAANAAAGTGGNPSNWTGALYFFRSGDFGGSGAATIFDGWGTWIPSAAPSATAFNGVVRTVSVQELSGTRIVSGLSGLGIEARIKLLCTRLRQWGRPGASHVYLNPTDWQRLADSLEARGYRMLDGGEAKFNFSGIKTSMGGKMVEIHADPFCPVGTCFAIDQKVCTMYSLDKFVHVLNDDGLTMLRKVSTNDFEFRIESFPAFVVAAPGNCGRVAV